ncbi:hypothetical protein [Krasilnikovia sp. M28-CT-15]|uniref:WXG100-like domain-containing protein n=1 Tax=Krasilnikovia sp. M28-CT-15 TaxID=3373540 RepID=UPI0038761588
MSLTVPPEIGMLFKICVGDDWPRADEDELRRLARAWQDAHYDLSGMVAEVEAATGEVLAALHGTTAVEYRKFMKEYLDAFPATITTLDQLAELCRATATEVEYAKYMIIGSLILLAGEIATAVAMAIPTFGASTAAIPALEIATQITVRTILRYLVTAVLRCVVLQVGLDAAVQGIQMLKGDRTHWDWRKTEGAAVAGVVGGVIGTGLHVGATKLAANLAKTLGGRVVQGGAHEFLTGAAVDGIYGTNGNSWSSFTAGAVEGIFESGGRRGRRAGAGTGVHLPDVSVTVPQVGGLTAAPLLGLSPGGHALPPGTRTPDAAAGHAPTTGTTQPQTAAQSPVTLQSPVAPQTSDAVPPPVISHPGDVVASAAKTDQPETPTVPGTQVDGMHPAGLAAATPGHVTDPHATATPAAPVVPQSHDSGPATTPSDTTHNSGTPAHHPSVSGTPMPVTPALDTSPTADTTSVDAGAQPSPATSHATLLAGATPPAVPVDTATVTAQPTTGETTMPRAASAPTPPLVVPVPGATTARVEPPGSTRTTPPEWTTNLPGLRAWAAANLSGEHLNNVPTMARFYFQQAFERVTGRTADVLPDGALTSIAQLYVTRPLAARELAERLVYVELTGRPPGLLGGGMGLGVTDFTVHTRLQPVNAGQVQAGVPPRRHYAGADVFVAEVAASQDRMFTQFEASQRSHTVAHALELAHLEAVLRGRSVASAVDFIANRLQQTGAHFLTERADHSAEFLQTRRNLYTTATALVATASDGQPRTVEQWHALLGELTRTWMQVHQMSSMATYADGRAIGHGEAAAMSGLAEVDRNLENQQWNLINDGAVPDDRRGRASEWGITRTTEASLNAQRLLDVKFTIGDPMVYAAAVAHWRDALREVYPHLWNRNGGQIIAPVLAKPLSQGYRDQLQGPQTVGDLVAMYDAAHAAAPLPPALAPHTFARLNPAPLNLLRTAFTADVRVQPASGQVPQPDQRQVGGAPVPVDTYAADGVELPEMYVSDSPRPLTKFLSHQRSHTVPWSMFRAVMHSFTGPGRTAADLFAFLDSHLTMLQADVTARMAAGQQSPLNPELATLIRYGRTLLANTANGTLLPPHEWSALASEAVRVYTIAHQASEAASYLNLGEIVGDRAQGHGEASHLAALQANEQAVLVGPLLADADLRGRLDALWDVSSVQPQARLTRRELAQAAYFYLTSVNRLYPQTVATRTDVVIGAVLDHRVADEAGTASTVRGLLGLPSTAVLRTQGPGLLPVLAALNTYVLGHPPVAATAVPHSSSAPLAAHDRPAPGMRPEPTPDAPPERTDPPHRVVEVLDPARWADRRAGAAAARIDTERFDPGTGGRTDGRPLTGWAPTEPSPGRPGQVWLDGALTHIRSDVRRIEVEPGRWVMDYTLRLNLRSHRDGEPGAMPGARAVGDADLHRVQDQVREVIAEQINGRYRLPGGEQLHVHVEFIAPGEEHAVVRVHDGVTDTDQLHWSAQVPPSILAHEVMHFLGLPDEAHDPRMIFRRDSGHPEHHGVMGTDAWHTVELEPRHLATIDSVTRASTRVRDTPWRPVGPIPATIGGRALPGTATADATAPRAAGAPVVTGTVPPPPPAWLDAAPQLREWALATFSTAELHTLPNDATAEVVRLCDGGRRVAARRLVERLLRHGPRPGLPEFTVHARLQPIQDGQLSAATGLREYAPAHVIVTDAIAGGARLSTQFGTTQNSHTVAFALQVKHLEAALRGRSVASAIEVVDHRLQRLAALLGTDDAGDGDHTAARHLLDEGLAIVGDARARATRPVEQWHALLGELTRTWMQAEQMSAAATFRNGTPVGHGEAGALKALADLEDRYLSDLGRKRVRQDGADPGAGGRAPAQTAPATPVVAHASALIDVNLRMRDPLVYAEAVTHWRDALRTVYPSVMRTHEHDIMQPFRALPLGPGPNDPAWAGTPAQLGSGTFAARVRAISGLEQATTVGDLLDWYDSRYPAHQPSAAHPVAAANPSAAPPLTQLETRFTADVGVQPRTGAVPGHDMREIDGRQLPVDTYSADQVELPDLSLSDERPKTKFAGRGQKSHTVPWSMYCELLHSFTRPGQPATSLLEFLDDRFSRLAADTGSGVVSAELVAAVQRGRQLLAESTGQRKATHEWSALISELVRLHTIAHQASASATYFNPSEPDRAQYHGEGDHLKNLYAYEHQASTPVAGLGVALDRLFDGSFVDKPGEHHVSLTPVELARATHFYLTALSRLYPETMARHTDDVLTSVLQRPVTVVSEVVKQPRTRRPTRAGAQQQTELHQERTTLGELLNLPSRATLRRPDGSLGALLAALDAYVATAALPTPAGGTTGAAFQGPLLGLPVLSGVRPAPSTTDHDSEGE